MDENGSDGHGKAAREEGMKVPSLKFSTKGFRKHEQFDAWCAFTTSMCDLQAISPAKEGFESSAASYQLDSMLLTRFDLAPMKFSLNEAMIRKTSLDHWCLSVVSSGEVAASATHNGFRAQRGKTVLHSYSIPFSGEMRDVSYTGLFFSRDEFWDIADVLDGQSHQCLEGPLAQIMRDYLLSMQKTADLLTKTEAMALRQAFGHLLRAMVHQTPSALDAAKVPIVAAQYDQARRFINANIGSPKLNPDMICGKLGMSRRQLYYLFEKQGGVASYIRNRRLAACYNTLTRSSGKMLVSSVAYDYGFTNTSSFCRQFQSRYGFSPKEARDARNNNQAPIAAHEASLVDWLMMAESA